MKSKGLRARATRGRRLLLAAAAAGLLALAALPAARWILWRRELNPVLRGSLLAGRQGCPACHLPYRAVEISNPGSRWGSVPRFQAGNFMMYGESRRDIEEFIRFGAPRSWLDAPETLERLESQRLRMPAYGSSLSDDQVADLVAWASVMEGIEPVGGEAVAAGRQLAREHGCLSCHGIEGSGGLPNPGSLGGFVPGFVGGNFADLVRDEDEFREWILDGTSSRLERNPVVRFFWRRQKVAMPAYRDDLDGQQIGELWRWVQALRAAERPTSEP
ncbi:MAG: c-type cytochrome [bacterium]|nr:c-type cytochrome [bacterium]